jgi:hypothetical protein
MKKKTPVCPSCHATYDPEVAMKSRRGRAAAKPAPEPAPDEVIESLPEAGGEEAEDTLIEDAEELGDDEEEIEVEKEEP